MTTPKTLLPVVVRDALICALVQTTTYVDPATGEHYRPDELPKVVDPDGDADSQ